MGELNAQYIPGRDFIGFDPTHNEAEQGTPRISPYGQALRATPPMMQVDLYPTFPYRGYLDFKAYQIYANSITEGLLAYTLGYRGIEPLDKQPLANMPYPYDQNYFMVGEVY